MEYLQNFKASPHKVFISCKGKISKFTVENTGGHHLARVLRLNTPSQQEHWRLVPSDVITEKDTILLCKFLAQKFIT